MVTAAETSRKTELTFELGRAMHELRNYIRQHIQLKIKENNISITFEMLEVMSVLWKKDGINQQELADVTLRDKSSMTYLIDNLVKRQMVKRMEDENDRRNKLIYLTEQGTALKGQLHPWVAEVYEKATLAIDIEALQQSVVLLNQMIGNLKTD
ncbi:MarR family transcriptional regulator [Mucilaginibacter sp. PAMB04274]|uniref:MarR family winged helix-turn-helix transcriptional regulator n=1 Tax=Mucilaginibacter sp. PAMB04274 TaxID=3138568 RepID=UPI0031F667CA